MGTKAPPSADAPPTAVPLASALPPHRGFFVPLRYEGIRTNHCAQIRLGGATLRVQAGTGLALTALASQKTWCRVRHV